MLDQNINNDNNTLISVDKVYANYKGKNVLKDISLNINKGDYVGIIGPNGGGKTTLLKLLINLLKPSSGSITKAENLIIGYLPQQSNIDFMFPINIEDVVYSGLLNLQKKNNTISFNKLKKEYSNRCNFLLDKMNLYNIKKKNIGELSGGQLQKVFLCRALISKPQLLLLDEPNTYIDSESEIELYEYITTKSNVDSFVVVSHNVDIISKYVNKLYYINEHIEKRM